MTVGNKVTVYKYNKNDELLRTDTLNTDTEEDSVVIYKNDKNGNQLATVNRYEIPEEKKDKPYIDIDVTLGDNRLNENVVNHYNAQNRLVRTLTKNYKVSFTYDAEGLRTSKTVNGEKTVFVWDGDQLVMELSGGGKVKKRYVRGNDRGYGSNLVYADKGENTEKQYYVTDLHGNVVQLTDENGAVIKTYEYDSFGNKVKPDGKDDNPFRYCGEYYDKETGEVYLRARYYQPAVGRFLTRDTYTGEEGEPLSLHLYTYCGNDGVNSADPSGHYSYIIYDENAPAGTKKRTFKDEARRVRKKYGKKSCYLIPVATAHDFKEKWDRYLGKKVKKSKDGIIKKVYKNKNKKIDKVYIILHGIIEGPEGEKTKDGKYKASGLAYFEQDSSSIYAKKTDFLSFYDETKDIEVKDLKKKTLNILTFSTCQSATSKGYSLAKRFKKRMNIKKYVIGYGGRVSFRYDLNELTALDWPGEQKL